MDKRIKVLHIITSSGLGGAQTIVRDLVNSQNNHYVYSFRKTKNNSFSEINNKVYYYNTYKSFKFNPLILINLYKVIRNYNFNVVHLHLVKPLIYVSIIKFLIPNLKVIYHEHGLIYSSDKTVKRPFWYVTYLNFFKNKIDIVIAISKLIEDIYLKETKIKRNKIKLLYNYVDLDKFNKKNIKWDIQKEQEKLKIKKGDFVIGFAGRLVEMKGWQELIGAMKKLKNEKIILLIAGIGPDKEKMLNLIKEYGLSKKIIYLGYMSNMVWFYSLLDCFVIPSYWEGHPIAQLEVSAFGLSLISSDGDGLNENFKNNEEIIYFKNKNVMDLVHKLKKVNNNKKLRNELSINLKKKSKLFSKENYINELNKLY